MNLFSPFKKYQRRLAELYEIMNELLPDEDSKILPGSDSEAVLQEINSLIEGEYSKAVFDHYSALRPDLIRIATGETVKWSDAFGNDFETIPKSLRHSLVGLVDGEGRYRIK